jgi:hypothetical protein
MSTEPKIDHKYHAGKDKLTIKIHRYSLKSKKARSQIMKKLIAAVERLPDRLIASAKKNKKKGAREKLPKSQKVSKLVEIGD